MNKSFNSRVTGGLGETFKSKMSNKKLSKTTLEPSNNGIGIQQVHVTDEVEPGHVPIDQINNVEM